MSTDRDLLKDTGRKATPQRLAIFKAVNRREGCFTPQELYRELGGVRPAPGLVTVYRSLKLLAGAGLICRIEGQGRGSRFARRPMSHHHHLVCAGCRRVVDFEQSESELLKLENRLQRDTGFAIQGHNLEFHGLCLACQSAGGRA